MLCAPQPQQQQKQPTIQPHGLAQTNFNVIYSTAVIGTFAEHVSWTQSKQGNGINPTAAGHRWKQTWNIESLTREAEKLPRSRWLHGRTRKEIRPLIVGPGILTYVTTLRWLTLTFDRNCSHTPSAPPLYKVTELCFISLRCCVFLWDQGTFAWERRLFCPWRQDAAGVPPSVYRPCSPVPNAVIGRFVTATNATVCVICEENIATS